MALEDAWLVLKSPMIDGSLARDSTWEDDEGFNNVRYVADFKHPETGEIHPMVADINHAKVDTMYGRSGYPTMNVKILDDKNERAIAQTDFQPEPSDDNFGNRNLIGKPTVNAAGPIQRLRGFSDWRDENPEHSDMSPMEYMMMLNNYKHQGHGTAMYDMAADILQRETRSGHVIVRDENQTESAERMWAKHKDREYWPHSWKRRE